MMITASLYDLVEPLQEVLDCTRLSWLYLWWVAPLLWATYRAVHQTPVKPLPPRMVCATIGHDPTIHSRTRRTISSMTCKRCDAMWFKAVMGVPGGWTYNYKRDW